MKQISFILILSLLGLNCDHSNKNDIRFGELKFYTNELIKKRLKEIIRTDSSSQNESSYIIYKAYDIENKIVRQLKYYQDQSNSQKGFLSRRIYNKNGGIILYELFNMRGIKLEQCNFEYNTKGLIIKKEWTDRDNIVITIKYFYSIYNELIDKKAFRFGKEIDDYFIKNNNADTLLPSKCYDL
jgi:hypothetical protein